MLKERSIKIIEVLAIFKFLNSTQLIRLWVAKHKSNLNTAFKELYLHNMIGKLSFWVHPKLWRLPNYYYLKPKGKNFLLEHLKYSEARIKMPIGTSSMFFRDYYHRTNAIDFQIELYLHILKQWWEILLYDTYYDHTWSTKKNSPLKAKTKLIFSDGSFFIPDAITKIKLNGVIKIFTFEIYNWLDTKRVVQQLHKHLKSLQEWLPSIILDEKKGSKVLLLFDLTSCMRAVMDRVLNDDSFLNFRYLFLFSDTISIKSDFNSWCSCEYKHVEL